MEIMPDGSAVLYDPRDDRGHVLTAVGALVWDMCDGSQTVAAIGAELATLLPQVADVAGTARELVASFQELDLLTAAPGEETA